MTVVTGYAWAKCPNCQSDHLLGLDDSGTVRCQFGLLIKQDDDPEQPFMFSYFSKATEERDDVVEFDLFGDDEEAIRTQACMIAANGLAMAISVPPDLMQIDRSKMQ